MNKFYNKLYVAVFTFIIGVSTFYLSDGFVSLVPFNANLFPWDIVSRPTTIAPLSMSSNKVEIRFVKFVQGKHEVEAEFELTNNSAENVYYYSYSKDSYPSPMLKREGKVVTNNRIRCASGIKGQTLIPGETAFYRVGKSEVTYEPTQRSWKQSDKPTQIGFPFLLGNERREITLWTEEIEFPR